MTCHRISTICAGAVLFQLLGGYFCIIWFCRGKYSLQELGENVKPLNDDDDDNNKNALTADNPSSGSPLAVRLFKNAIDGKTGNLKGLEREEGEGETIAYKAFFKEKFVYDIIDGCLRKSNTLASFCFTVKRVTSGAY